MDPRDGKIICNRCGNWYNPGLIECPTCSRMGIGDPPFAPTVIHLLIGAVLGFYTWHKTKNELLALGAGAVSAWFFGTKFGRFVALLAVLVVLALLFFAR